jgi:signal transduction histidine kinase
LSVVVEAMPVGRLPIDTETALYRIAQEALGNAVRHSAARNIRLSLRRDGSLIELQVHDDGRGFDPAAHSEGLGLHSMRERAQSVGGVYEVHSAPGQGCVVSVRVPIR